MEKQIITLKRITELKSSAHNYWDNDPCHEISFFLVFQHGNYEYNTTRVEISINSWSQVHASFDRISVKDDWTQLVAVRKLLLHYVNRAEEVGYYDADALVMSKARIEFLNLIEKYGTADQADTFRSQYNDLCEPMIQAERIRKVKRTAERCAKQLAELTAA